MLALHAPDGFLQPGTAAVTAVLSAVTIGYALRRSKTALEERQLPLAGVSAAFIFAAQMVKFPVASGTTGHLIGAALAAILLGPLTGAMVVAIVVCVQAIVFADGGLSALGYNVLNMAIVPAIGGYGLFILFRRMLPNHYGGVIGAAGLAAWGSVVFGAGALCLEWLFGASAPVAFDTVFQAMVSVHALIGVGEGVITGLALGAVLRARPDIVAGVADLNLNALSRATQVPMRTFVVGGGLVALLTGAVMSQFSVDRPDGLEYVSSEVGIGGPGTSSVLDNGVFASYATSGVSNKNLSLGIAGATGTLITLVVGYGLLTVARPSRAHQQPSDPASHHQPAG